MCQHPQPVLSPLEHVAPGGCQGPSTHSCSCLAFHPLLCSSPVSRKCMVGIQAREVQDMVGLGSCLVYVSPGREFCPTFYPCDLKSPTNSKATVQNRVEQHLFLGNRLVLPIQMPSSLLRCMYDLGPLLNLSESVSLSYNYLLQRRVRVK